MILRGFDSAGNLNAGAAIAAGGRGWGRYLTGYPLTHSEVADATSRSLGIWSIFEASATGALGGEAKGRTDAAMAIAAARALGQPAGSAIYFAVDFDAVGGQVATCLLYFRGAAAITHAGGYRMGGYGGHSLITAALAAKVVDLAYVSGGWENGLPETGIALKQHAETMTVGSATVDVVDILASDVGAWNGHGRITFGPVALPSNTNPKATPAKVVAKAIAHPIATAKKVAAKVAVAVKYPPLIPPGIIVANPHGRGDFYVRHGKKAGIPDPATMASLIKRGAKLGTMPTPALDSLPVVRYGSN